MLGEDIRRLCYLTYPTVSREMSESLVRYQFVDALVDFDTRLRIQQSRPKTLKEAVTLAVEIDAFSRAERQRRENKGFARQTYPGESQSSQSSELTGIVKAIERLERQVANLSSAKQRSANTNVQTQCFFCKEVGGHIKKFCPSRKAPTTNI